MPSLWCPGAVVVTGGVSGGSMVGGAARAVEHTFESGYGLTAVNGMKSLIAANNTVHLCFNPVTGQYAQGLPANVAGRGLVNQDGGVQTNREGSVCIQTEVVAFAANPWVEDLTDAGRAALEKINAWRNSWGIPNLWPAGRPPGSGGPFPRSTTTWTTKAGYFGHSQVPENSHWDPGRIDIVKFFPSATPPPEEIQMGYYRPDGASQPGDGYIFVDGTGVYGITGTQWNAVLIPEGHAVQLMPRATWVALRDSINPDPPTAAQIATAVVNALNEPTVDEIAAAVVAALPAPSTGVFPTPAEIAIAVNDELARRQQA